jgi:ketosteroid isomerase-like protein
MSQENVETVLRGYELANRGEPSLELLSPDIEIHLAGVFPDMEPMYRGRAGARRWMEQSIEAWEEITFETDRAIDLGDRVLVLGHFDARGRDRIEVRRPFANLWTLHNGQAVRMDGFATQPQALKAVGLSEQDAHADS